MKEFSTTELLLIRQWLALFSNTASIKIEHVRDAAEAIANVDKELWGRLISAETPWGSMEASETITFEDDNFEQTLESISKSDEEKKE